MEKAPKRRNGWSEDIHVGDLTAAADEVKTPENKRTKTFGLRAHGKSVGGSSRIPPMAQAGSMGQYDRKGNQLSRGGTGGGGGAGASMQRIGSGIVSRNTTQTHFSSPPPQPPHGRQLKAARSFFGDARAEKPRERATPGIKTVLTMAPSQGSRSLAAGRSSQRQPQAKTGGGARINPGASIGATTTKPAMVEARTKRKQQGQGTGYANRWKDGSGDEADAYDTRVCGSRSEKLTRNVPQSITNTYGTARGNGSGGSRSSVNDGGWTRPSTDAYSSSLRQMGPTEPVRRRKSQSAATVPRKAGPPKSPEVVTVDDSDSDSEHEEEVEEAPERCARGDGEGTGHHGAQKRRRPEETSKDGGDGSDEWRGQAPTNRASEEGRKSESSSAQDRGESTEAEFGSVPEMAAEAVMVGKWVVRGSSYTSINMRGDVKIGLNGGGDTKDTAMCIPSGEITFFGFCEGRGTAKAFIAIKTKADGSIANDPSYRRLYDPTDHGAAGLITVFLRTGHKFGEHAKSIVHAITPDGEHANVVNTDLEMKGELPRILRLGLEKDRTAAKEEEQSGRLRTRRTLRSAVKMEEFGKVIFHYPPEASASDRVAINILDEARTQEGEFLNDSLVDLYLKHMHREAFRQWQKGDGDNGDDGGVGGVAGGGGVGGGGSAAGATEEGEDTSGVAGAAAVAAGDGRAPRMKGGGRSMDERKVHVFTSHFFTKLTESRLYDFDAAYSKVEHWTGNEDLFEKKFVLVPVVQDMHWSLACLCNLDKLEINKEVGDFCSDEAQPCILFLDSLDMHHASRIYNYLRKYLEKKWEQKHEKMAFDEDVLPLVRPKVPTQINGCDCGVYVLRYAKEICRQWPTVTAAEVKNRLRAYFGPQLFSPADISDERRKLRELLQECKVRYEKEKERQKSKQEKGKGKTYIGGGGRGGSSTTSSSPDVEEAFPPAPLGDSGSAAAASLPSDTSTCSARPGSDVRPIGDGAPVTGDAKGVESSGPAAAYGEGLGGVCGTNASVQGSGDDSEEGTAMDTEIDGGDIGDEDSEADEEREGEGASGEEENAGDQAGSRSDIGAVMDNLRPLGVSESMATRQEVGDGEDRCPAVAKDGDASDGSSSNSSTNSAEAGDCIAKPAISVADVAVSDQGAGGGQFCVTGSCWGASSPPPVQGEDGEEEEVQELEKAGENPKEAANGAGSAKAHATAVRRKKRATVAAAAAEAGAGLPFSHEDESQIDSCRDWVGQGNAATEEGRPEPHCAEQARTGGDNSRSIRREKRKAEKPPPLRQRGENGNPPRVHPNCKGTGSAITTANGRISTLSQGGEASDNTAAVVADENALSPTAKGKRKQHSSQGAARTAAAAALPVGDNVCRGRRADEGTEQARSQQADGIVVLGVDGADADDGISEVRLEAASSYSPSASAKAKGKDGVKRERGQGRSKKSYPAGSGRGSKPSKGHRTKIIAKLSDSEDFEEGEDGDSAASQDY